MPESNRSLDLEHSNFSVKMTVKQLDRAIDDFAQLKREVVTRIAGCQIELMIRGQKKKYLTKSAWRWIALVFNISTEIVHRENNTKDGSNSWRFTIRATLPNGRFAEAVGACSSTEKRFVREADIETTAQTRATSRAIADLVGGGEVSAEEMIGSDDSHIGVGGNVA